MGNITYAQICNAVEDTLDAATGLAKSQTFSELSESYEDLPLLRVYPQSGEVDSRGSSDRTTFRAGVRVTECLLHADVICRQRSHIDLDMSKTVEMVEAVEAVLITQQAKPYFGLTGIKGFHWRWEIVDFPLGAGESAVHYLGARFSITLEVF
jgi:hypothetical protein